MAAGTELKIAIEDPSQPEIIALLRDGEAYSAKLYPAESNHHMPLDALRAGTFVSWWPVTPAVAQSEPARLRSTAPGLN